MAISVCKQLVNRNIKNLGLLGFLVSPLYGTGPTEQKHKDKREFEEWWSKKAWGWRYMVFVGKGSEDLIAEIDIHKDGTVNVKAFEPIGITIDRELDVLIMQRYRMD